MPFKSEAQRRFMFLKHPQMAKEWAKETKDIKKLPERAKKKEALALIEKNSSVFIDALKLAVPLTAAAGGGFLGGVGLSKLLSPPMAELQNIRRKEVLQMLQETLEDIQDRVAVKKYFQELNR